MLENYIDSKQEIEDLKKEYKKILKKEDYKILNQRSETFLLHAMKHLITQKSESIEFPSTEWETKITQYYLNLAIGLELLLKSALLKNDVNISPGSRSL